MMTMDSWLTVPLSETYQPAALAEGRIDTTLIVEVEEPKKELHMTLCFLRRYDGLAEHLLLLEENNGL
jgi:hypothetical protein